jgi:signal transduction histidine kinase
MPESKETVHVDMDPVDKVSWELMDTYETLSTIHTLSQLLTESGDVSEAALTTLQHAADITDSIGGVLFIPRGGEMEYLAGLNEGEPFQDVALDQYRHHRNKPHYEDQLPDGIIASDGREIGACLYVPFPMGEDRYGFICQFSSGDKEYCSIDIKRVDILCGQGALAIQCFIHMNELRKKNLALQDTLDQLTAAQEELVRSERLSALGQMASMIVHDIKNPMGGILGYAQILESMAGGLSADEVREYSRFIIKEMLRLSRMTEEIMEFSRGMESSLNCRNLTSKDLIAVALPLIESDLKEEGMGLTCKDLEDQTPISADSDKMERVFINLAVNARNAMEESGVLTISSRREGEWVEFSFKDSGKGIPPELREHIFQPFVRNQAGKKGLGLGLAISRWVVDAHGGEIWIHSSDSGGTDMRIRLQVAPMLGGRNR